LKKNLGWLEAIQSAFAQQADVIPPGWQTLDEIAQQLGKNKYHVCRDLNALVKMGAAETKKFRTWVKPSRDVRGHRRGYVRMNRHYRIIRAENKKT